MVLLLPVMCGICYCVGLTQCLWVWVDSDFTKKEPKIRTKAEHWIFVLCSGKFPPNTLLRHTQGLEGDPDHGRMVCDLHVLTVLWLASSGSTVLSQTVVLLVRSSVSKSDCFTKQLTYGAALSTLDNSWTNIAVAAMTLAWLSNQCGSMFCGSCIHFKLCSETLVGLFALVLEACLSGWSTNPKGAVLTWNYC